MNITRHSIIIYLVILSLNGCSYLKNNDELSQLKPTETTEQWMMQGDNALADNNKQAALENYVKALNLDNYNAELFYKIGKIHSDLEHSDLAQEALQLGLAIAPNHNGILENLGLLALKKQHYGDAENYFKKILTTDTKHWRVYNALGLISDYQKNHSQALRYYQQALALQANNALVLSNRGYCYYLAGDWANAEKDYLSALAQQPLFNNALNNLALLQARQGKNNEALATFKKSMDEASAYNNLGYLNLLDGHYSEAQNYLQRAISLSPSYHAQAFKNMDKLHSLWQ